MASLQVQLAAIDLELACIGATQRQGFGTQSIVGDGDRSHLNPAGGIDVLGDRKVAQRNRRRRLIDVCDINNERLNRSRAIRRGCLNIDGSGLGTRRFVVYGTGDRYDDARRAVDCELGRGTRRRIRRALLAGNQAVRNSRPYIGIGSISCYTHRRTVCCVFSNGIRSGIFITASIDIEVADCVDRDRHRVSVAQRRSGTVG